MEDNGLKELIPIDFHDYAERIKHLISFIEHVEEDLFDIDEYDKEKCLDVKIMKYEKAKKTLNEDLNYMFKIYSNKNTIDPNLASLFKILTSLDDNMKTVLKATVKGLITGKIKEEDVFSLLGKRVDE